MITTEGKVHIKRYLAGMVPSIGRSIAVGIGNSAEIDSSTKLQFEAGRTDVSLVSYDFVQDELVFKAPLDEIFGGTIYEVALYSTSADVQAGEFGSKVLTTFDSDQETWLDATTALASSFVTTNTRIGIDSLSHTQAASAVKTDALAELFLDFSGYSNADRFVFAFNVGNANTSSIRFRFMTDASNYYEFSLGAQTTGYKIVEAAKSSATVTGAPDWSSITEIRVSSTSTAGGASSLNFDAIRIDDAESYNQDYVMISREVLATPFVKQEGSAQEVEFRIKVSL